MLRKINALVMLIGVCFASYSVESVSYDFEFDDSIILVMEDVSTGIYVVSRGNDSHYSDQPNTPFLPIYDKKVLLPSSISLVSGEVNVIEKKIISSGKDLLRVPPVYPTNDSNEDNFELEAFKGEYINPQLKNFNLHEFKEGSLVNLTISPFEYDSTNKNLYLITKCAVISY